MRQYLLDTSPLSAYLRGSQSAGIVITPWVLDDAVATSILSYGEVVEYVRALPSAASLRENLRVMLEEIIPLPLDYAIMERYADLRRLMRKPYGDGLIGDIDTLIAATALEHGLTVVTADTDFQAVPGLDVMMVPRKM